MLHLSKNTRFLLYEIIYLNFFPILANLQFSVAHIGIDILLLDTIPNIDNEWEKNIVSKKLSIVLYRLRFKIDTKLTKLLAGFG